MPCNLDIDQIIGLYILVIYLRLQADVITSFVYVQECPRIDGLHLLVICYAVHGACVLA